MTGRRLPAGAHCPTALPVHCAGVRLWSGGPLNYATFSVTGGGQGSHRGCAGLSDSCRRALTLTSVSSQDVKQASHERRRRPLSESLVRVGLGLSSGACVLCLSSMRHICRWTPGFLTALDQDFFKAI